MANNMYRPNGQLQGDTKPVRQSNASTAPSGPMQNSTDGVSLREGYKPMGGIADATQSDQPDWA